MPEEPSTPTIGAASVDWRRTLILGPRPRWVVHPTLVAAAYVLNTALANEVTGAGYIRALVVAMVVAATLTIGAWGATGNRWDGALLVTAGILVLVSPVSIGWIWYVLRGTFGGPIGTLATELVLVAGLGGVGVMVLRRRRRHLPPPRPAPETLNVLSIALVVAVVASNLVGLRAHATAAVLSPPAGWQGGTSETPDIVVLLLDGYPRSDVLARRLGADNSAFLAALEERGFDVDAASHSNYALTELTFPSMFQMRYIEQIPSIRPFLGSGGQNNAVLRDAAEAGQAFTILHAAGYSVTIWSAGWEHVALRRAADQWVDTGELNDLERSVLYRTWLLYFFDVAWPGVFTGSQRDRIVHAFDTFDERWPEHSDAPRFFFVHVPGPHLPLVVRADGTPVDLPASRFEGFTRAGYGMTDAEYADAWQSEIDYLDARVIRSVDRMLGSEAGRQAVIIVMSDHGYGFELLPNDTQARLGNLFAARTPGAFGLLSDSPTPVNLFRVLFNQYLGTQFSIPPDRYFLNGQRQLDLTEVVDPDQVPPK